MGFYEAATFEKIFPSSTTATLKPGTCNWRRVASTKASNALLNHGSFSLAVPKGCCEASVAIALSPFNIIEKQTRLQAPKNMILMSAIH